jgi:hypothetical protein
MQSSPSVRRHFRHALGLSLALAALALGGGCGGSDEEEPVTPPVADPTRAETLAGKYEPDLMLERSDGFWPVSLLTIDHLRAGERGICLAAERGAPCNPIATAKLEWNAEPGSAFIDYPADNNDRDAQHDVFVRALGHSAPGTRARMYYYVTGRDPERPVSLQYWFYYPFNYLPVHLPGPFSGTTLVNSDLHEGDFEGMAILLSAHAHQPVYVWMPRHADEGERFVWNQGILERHGTHPVGYVARGSHATYESCGRKFRTAFAAGQVLDIPDDNASCTVRDTYELGSGVPAIDLARTWWACWPGHLGNAPGFGSDGGIFNQVRGQFDADGPRSPLFQQKFDLNGPQPCANVPAPSEVPRDREVLADPETAAVLGQSGGRLNDLFRSCDEWSQRPPEGSYMVACDQATLDAFFDSGLEDPGPQDLRVLGEPEPTGPTVPAVFASRQADAVDRATIETSGIAHPQVYVAIRNGRKLTTAEFPEFEMQPEQRLRLRRESGSLWRLVDLDSGRRVARASGPAVESEVAISPQVPQIAGATRDGDEIELRFSGGTDPATRLVAFAGPTRSELIEAGRIVGAVRGEASGSYLLRVADPSRELHFVRVVASRDGALAASQVAEVGEAP